jgi:hypothetical protein
VVLHQNTLGPLGINLQRELDLRLGLCNQTDQRSCALNVHDLDDTQDKVNYLTPIKYTQM